MSFLNVFPQLKYRDEAKKEFNNYSIVTDTPVYVTAILGHTWASEVRKHLQKELHDIDSKSVNARYI